MFLKSVLVTGCNKGIGLEFIRQLAAGGVEHIFATSRQASHVSYVFYLYFLKGVREE